MKKSPPPIRKSKRLLFKALAFASAAVACALLVWALRLSHSLEISTGKMERLAATELTVKASDEGKTTLVLPDGSAVTLNARSTLTYPANFGMDGRHVKMNGEAYFDVRGDGSEFTVSAPGMDVSVHGTKFNIYAYPESDSSEMTLVEGSVTVSNGRSELRVAAGEKVNISRTDGRMNLGKTDGEMETAWMKNRLVFVHVPLREVFDILCRRFAVQIESSGLDLEDCYTASFRDNSVTEILDVLKMHYGFDYRYQDHKVTISRKEQ